MNGGSRRSRLDCGPADGTHSAVVKGEVNDMLYYAVIFFVTAIIAAVLGLTGIAAGAAGIAKALFVVFLIVVAVSLLFGRRAMTP